MKTYHKLVRDRIPEIIIQAGKQPETRVLDDEEYSKMLREKLMEEVQEYLTSGDVEELADILEVMLSLSKLHGATWADVETIAERKRAERGGFQEKILLIQVRDK
ncbi:nucleoside triphosphate pyrophosphohydrolase [Heliobacterium chlorum]|uniref:Nucleoside triphosphate pyrophosphohydrolase n=1 Tax=Heliobacterium chlorum TaxID=2698 RepID=A0ABR7T827_HELCL|nr:nucleoside triphosphate pyrophosphohydrolase [Heliobacterium chlorum]